jgi:hypothetical protein
MLTVGLALPRIVSGSYDGGSMACIHLTGFRMAGHIQSRKAETAR